MSSLRKEIDVLLSSTSSYSILHWIQVLNIFEFHKDELDLEDIIRLKDRCECCRAEFNSHNTDTIEQSDTNPNIYEYLEQLEAKHNIIHTPIQDDGRDADLFGGSVAIQATG